MYNGQTKPNISISVNLAQCKHNYFSNRTIFVNGQAVNSKFSVLDYGGLGKGVFRGL